MAGQADFSVQAQVSGSLSGNVLASFYQAAGGFLISTPVPAAADVLVLQGLAQALTNKTLTSPVINGTVTTTGLTMPAFTGGGDITLGANKLKFTQLLIKDLNNYQGLLVKAIADNAFLPVTALSFYVENGNIVFLEASGSIDSGNADTNYIIGRARDSGVGLVEIWRGQGAADPYFSVGGIQQNKFYNSGVVDLGGNITLTADITLKPTTDNNGSFGDDTHRLKLVRAVTVTAGDFKFENGWRFTEDEIYGVALISPGNKKFRMVEV